MTTDNLDEVMVAPVQQKFDGMPKRLYSASPSKLLAWLDCPRRYRMQYLDRPRPAPRSPRAHTSVGVSTHNVLRDFWDLTPADRTPTAVTSSSSTTVLFCPRSLVLHTLSVLLSFSCSI